MAEVLGTWLLSMLAGHRRYSHVTTIRCDGINPGLLGMRKVISEDALRNALKRIPEAAGAAWLDTHLADSVAPLLDAAWILDTDTTIKPLYGHQEGALIGYNPKKPGRPSHAYHTYLMAGLRQVLGVEVRAGICSFLPAITSACENCRNSLHTNPAQTRAFCNPLNE